MAASGETANASLGRRGRVTAVLVSTLLVSPPPWLGPGWSWGGIPLGGIPTTYFLYPPCGAGFSRCACCAGHPLPPPPSPCSYRPLRRPSPPLQSLAAPPSPPPPPPPPVSSAALWIPLPPGKLSLPPPWSGIPRLRCKTAPPRAADPQCLMKSRPPPEETIGLLCCCSGVSSGIPPHSDAVNVAIARPVSWVPWALLGSLSLPY